jgi:hypothetical protein
MPPQWQAILAPFRMSDAMKGVPIKATNEAWNRYVFR